MKYRPEKGNLHPGRNRWLRARVGRLVPVLDVDDDLDLLLRMDVRSDAGDAHVVDVLESHVQVLGNVMVVAPGDETELVLTEIDGDGIGVEGIVLLADQVELGPDLEILEGLAAFPVAESGNVEVGQMDFLHGLSVFASHNASDLKLNCRTFFLKAK